MRRRSGLIVGVLVAASAIGGFSIAQQTPSSHNLLKLRAEGKVEAVLWTRRADHYTLQVIFPRGIQLGRSLQPATNVPDEGAPRLAYPDVRVWLLKDDGTMIAPLKRLAVAPSLAATAVARGASDTARRIEVMYEFPLSAGTEAVAIAMQVDGDYRIEPITPLGS